MGLVGLVALSSILVSPITDSYFSDKIQELDNKKQIILNAPIPLGMRELENTELKRKKLVVLLEAYQNLQKSEDYQPYYLIEEQTKNPQTIRYSYLYSSIYKKEQELRKLLDLNNDENRYTLKSLAQELSTTSLIKFSQSFFPQNEKETIVYSWLGDLAIEQGDIRAAVWAFEKYLSYAGYSENKKKARAKLTQSYKFLSWKKKLQEILDSKQDEYGISEEDITALPEVKPALPQISFKFDNEYDYGRPTTNLKVFNDKTKDRIINYSDKASDIYAEKYLVLGNTLFVPKIKSETMVSVVAFDLKTGAVLVDREIARLHSIFKDITKSVTGWVDEGKLNLIVADVVYVMDNYDLELIDQHELTQEEFNHVKSLDPQTISMRVLEELVAHKNLYNLTAQLQENSTNLTIDGMNSYLGESSINNIQQTFLNAWGDYSQFTFQNPLIQYVIEKAKIDDIRVGTIAANLLVRMAAENEDEFLDFFTKEFLESSNPDLKIRGYIAFLCNYNQYISNMGKKASFITKSGYKAFGEIGILHSSLYVRKATLDALINGYLDVTLFVKNHTKELLKAILQETDPRLQERFLGITRHVKEPYTKELLGMYENFLTTALEKKNYSLAKIILFLLGEGERTVTQKIEDLLFQIITTDPELDKDFDLYPAAAYAIGTSSGPDMYKRLDLMYEFTQGKFANEKYFYYDALQNIFLKLKSIGDEQKAKILDFISRALPEDLKEYLEVGYNAQMRAANMLSSKLLTFEEKRAIIFTNLNRTTVSYTLTKIISEQYFTETYTLEELEKIFRVYTGQNWWAKDCLKEFLFFYKTELYDFLLKTLKEEPESKKHLKPALLEMALAKIEYSTMSSIESGVVATFTVLKSYIAALNTMDVLKPISIGLLKLIKNGSEAQKVQAFIYFNELPNKFTVLKELDTHYSNSTAEEKDVLPEVRQYLEKQNLPDNRHIPFPESSDY